MWDRKARVERGAVFSILVEHEAGGVCGGWVEVVIEKASLLASSAGRCARRETLTSCSLPGRAQMSARAVTCLYAIGFTG
jgi:hypothetical protein